MKKLVILLLFLLLSMHFSYVFWFSQELHREKQKYERELMKVLKVKDLKSRGTFNISAYCDCPICTQTAKGSLTYTGRKPQQGLTIACPKEMLHTFVYIDTIGLRYCEDIGGAIKGNKIDIYFSAHSKALEFGRKNLKVYEVH